MLVSIIIVNYNVRDLLLAAVASLRSALTGIESEIIVVDNASSDGAIEALAERFPEVIAVQLDRNVGFGAANNVAIERATGEYILLLNPDTIVEENTVRTMIEFMERTPRAGFAGCRVILPDGSFDAAAKRGFPSPWSSFCKVFGLSRLFPSSRLFGGYNLTYVGEDVTARVDAICGCFMFCRGDLLKQLGGFDAEYFMYGEDLDLCYRATKAGWEIYYHPATTIIHVKGESTRRSSIDALAVFYEAMEIFARKHFRGNSALLMLVRLGIVVRRVLARFEERLPHWGFVPIDAVAVLLGLVVGSVVKTGMALGYPGWSLPVVYTVPPMVFVLALALSGGYRLSQQSMRGTATGYLLGFFALSALTYFFKDYAFSRGIVLVTTAVAAAIGMAARFIWLLWRAAFGADAFRRVAYLAREAPGPGVRDGIRRLFPGHPVTIVGAIAPTFHDLDALPGAHLGTVEGLAKIVRTHRLTDVVVLDRGLGYSEVMRAMTLCGAAAARFHIAVDGLESPAVRFTEAGASVMIARRPRSRTIKRLRDATLSLALLMLRPVVYLAGRPRTAPVRSLLDAVAGVRPLVGAGTGAVTTVAEPVFTVAELFQNEPLSDRQAGELEEYYRANASFLFDCEIILSVIRFRNAPAPIPLASDASPIGTSVN